MKRDVELLEVVSDARVVFALAGAAILRDLEQARLETWDVRTAHSVFLGEWWDTVSETLLPHPDQYGVPEDWIGWLWRLPEMCWAIP